MKLLNTELNSSLISKLQSYRLDKLFIVFLLSLSIASCGGNGSSNVSNGNQPPNDANDFGVEARRQAREELQNQQNP